MIYPATTFETGKRSETRTHYCVMIQQKLPEPVVQFASAAKSAEQLAKFQRNKIVLFRDASSNELMGIELDSSNSSRMRKSSPKIFKRQIGDSYPSEMLYWWKPACTQ